ncbi:MAG: hypothetical protein QNJ34_00975, partial [Xenococcaceae cyanobacterium MO_188.B29]|nr:hypothetical protein [Xenococcaceae cyanobacterium MO_188.B29]
EQKLFYAQWRSSSDNWRSRPSPHFHHSVNAKLLPWYRTTKLIVKPSSLLGDWVFLCIHRLITDN